MTDELKKEAEEYLRKQTQLNGGGLFHCNILNLILGFAEPREKRIAELEKENAELKAQIENDRDLPAIAYMQGAEKQKKKDTDQLTKAKEHIRTLISCLLDWVQEGDKDYCHIAEAEQFLNSEVEK